MNNKNLYRINTMPASKYHEVDMAWIESDSSVGRDSLRSFRAKYMLKAIFFGMLFVVGVFMVILPIIVNYTWDPAFGTSPGIMSTREYMIRPVVMCLAFWGFYTNVKKYVRFNQPDVYRVQIGS